MTIQPLIDNAINYAMEVITETCHIVLTGYAVDGVIHIKVTNNGSQFEEHLLEKLENGSVKSHGHRYRTFKYPPAYPADLWQ